MDRLWCGSGKSREDKDDTGSGVQVARPTDAPRPLKPMTTAGGTAATLNIPEVNVDLRGMLSYTVAVRRGSTGFGFTVFGSSPVQISRVDPGSPAHVAGLRTNDYIVRINGQNVSRSTAESVARIVREAEQQIALEIQRPSSSEDDLASLSSYRQPDDEPTSGRCQNPPLSTAWPDLRAAGQELTSTVSLNGGVRPLSGSKFGGRQPFASIGNLKRRTEMATGSETDAISACRGASGSTASMVDSGLGLRRVATGGSNVKTSSPLLGTSGLLASHMKAERLTQLTDSGRQTGSDDTSACSARGRSYSDAESQREERDEAIRQMSLRKLAGCEREFAAQMALGVHHYISALHENSLISPTDHAALFLNLELIHTLAEERADRWAKSNDADSIPEVYLSTIDALCEAYEAYCSGVRNSIRLLVELKRSPDFAAFLKSSDAGHLTLSAFLKKPIEHIKDLVLGLQKVLSYTSALHPDYEHLRQIVHAVRNCCNRINANNLYASSTSLATTTHDTLIPSSSWSGSSSSLSSSTSPSSAATPTSAGAAAIASSVVSCGSRSVISSIDAELLDIQSRLVFPKHIPVFHLATPSRHLIYSGALTLVDSRSGDRVHTPSFAVLMSDLLLLTRPDLEMGTLTVLYEPIALQDIVGSNFQCGHPCEFLLSIETQVTTLQESWEPYSLTLRAPSVELKCTWKNILEQRILTCKAQRQQLAASRSVENVV